MTLPSRKCAPIKTQRFQAPCSGVIDTNKFRQYQTKYQQAPFEQGVLMMGMVLQDRHF